jgi:eukaryotic-like serine/threonine-protein kinase
MGLSAGAKLGPYEILSPLGAGGMGEVYRARDTKLNRHVALKVLPEALAHDAERMARFKREAQVLASLNHPNIAAIYGLEESDGLRALVMELVEGQTLAERIAGTQPLTPGPSPQGRGERTSGNIPPSAQGREPALKETKGWPAGPGEGSRRAPIQIEDALPIAKQIAEALEYAHERGIIHRDLKPANVKVTPEGTVKVLDFGLAKALDVDPTSSNLSNSPTLSPTLSFAATQAGVILGTAAYMSPEQARGKQVDRRADIWAFGCVIFEMLGGRKPFEGETVTDVLAAVVRAEPDLESLPGSTPPRIRELARRCLTKDPKQRLQAIGEARIAIEETISGSPLPSAPLPQGEGGPEGWVRVSPVRRALPWAIAGLLAVVAVWLAVGYIARAPKPQPVIRFEVPPPENTEFTSLGSFLSVSPNGQSVAFITESAANAPTSLWIRAFDNLTAEQIRGTDQAFLPFWSPDGSYVGFFANDNVEKVALSGGQPQTLCTGSVQRGGTWSQDGTILYSSQGNLYSVPDAGGTPTLVVTPDKARREGAYLYPQFLPDGKHFIFSVAAETGGISIAVGSLGSKEITRLGSAGSNAFYAPPGELLYLSGSTLMTRPFDAKALSFTGQAVPVAENVGELGGSQGYFSVSPSGVLAYQAGVSVTQNRMTWFNRDGKELGTLGPTGIYECPAISPDGDRIAVDVGPEGKADIWVYDLKRGTGSRLTFNPAYDFNPSWTPDGNQILFTSERNGPRDIYQKASNGLGATQLVYASKEAKSLDDVTPDGHYAIFDTGGGNGSQVLGVLPLTGERKPFTFVQGDFSASNAQFSPNGHYLAYVTNETGRSEVYVQTFPQHTGKWQISTAGGVNPAWSHDGKELYYLSPKNEMMAVGVSTNSATLQAGTPKLLFQAHIMPPSYWRSNYVVSPDGRRFLMLVPAGETKQSSITVVVNWPALIKKP